MPPPPSVHRKLKTAQRVDGRAEVGRRSQAVRLLVAEGPRGGRGISGSRGGAGGSGGEQQRRSSSAADGSMTLRELADDTSTASDRTVSPALLTETRAESGAAAAPPHLYDLATGHPGLAMPSAVLYSATTTDVDVRCGRSALRGRLQATPLEIRHTSPEPPLETPAHTRCASFAQCIDMCAADTVCNIWQWRRAAPAATRLAVPPPGCPECVAQHGPCVGSYFQLAGQGMPEQPSGYHTVCCTVPAVSRLPRRPLLHAWSGRAVSAIYASTSQTALQHGSAADDAATGSAGGVNYPVGSGPHASGGGRLEPTP